MTEINTEEKKNSSLWNYEVISAFNESYYKDLLTKKDVSGSEKMIKEVVTFIKEDDNIIEKSMLLNNYYFVLQKNNTKYLLESSYVHLLPIIIDESIKVGYNKEGYVFIQKFRPVGFRPDKVFNFRQIVDNFAYFEHSNPAHYKVWKIISLALYLSRGNIRVCSEPAFGKDSIIALLDDLVGRIGVVQKPTIAKLEYLTNNKLLLVNEFMNLNAQETRDIEQYLLTVGDFKNKYQKRSRAHASLGGSEEYDISKFSLILAFNRLEDYPDGEKIYFDFVHTNQLKERFLPLRFSGKLTHSFERQANPKILADAHKEFFVGMAKSINYYADENNVRAELKPYSSIDFDFKDRWKINFNVVCKFINLYANNEQEYKKMVNIFYQAHIDYLSMISKNNHTLNRQYIAGVTEGTGKLFEEYIE
jgi:hypothetical protein